MFDIRVQNIFSDKEKHLYFSIETNAKKPDITWDLLLEIYRTVMSEMYLQWKTYEHRKYQTMNWR